MLHSFRHYVATQLGRIEGLREQVRKDILGHAGDSITAERYSETTRWPPNWQPFVNCPRCPCVISAADVRAVEAVRAVARKTREGWALPVRAVAPWRRSASPA